MTVALVLLSAFLHAWWNALLRLEHDKDRAVIAAIGAAAALAIAVAGARWALGEFPFATLASLGWAVVAGVFELAYFTSLARALGTGTLGVVYTISRGGAIVLVWPISIAVLGEPVSAAAVAGTIVVLGGLVLAGAGTPGRAPRDAGRAIAWSIAGAASIAGYHLSYKAALAAGGSPSAVFAVALIVATVINLARLGRAGRRLTWDLTRARAPRIVGMGVVCGGAFLIFVEALASGGAGFVLTLRNTSVLFAAGMSWWIGDPPRRAQIAGALLVAAGAVMMAC